MDKILSCWLDAQHEKGGALADSSDLLKLVRLDRQRFVASFQCKGLVQEGDGRVCEANRFEVGYRFGEDYLRSVKPLDVVTWFAPKRVFHPNINPPICCLGSIAPGTSLTELVYRTYEVISYQNVMPDERDALNPIACKWARDHQDRFPLDDRPLKRRGKEVHVEVLGAFE